MFDITDAENLILYMADIVIEARKLRYENIELKKEVKRYKDMEVKREENDE